jgi:hypothetical protein
MSPVIRNRNGTEKILPNMDIRLREYCGEESRKTIRTVDDLFDCVERLEIEQNQYRKEHLESKKKYVENRSESYSKSGKIEMDRNTYCCEWMYKMFLLGKVDVKIDSHGKKSFYLEPNADIPTKTKLHKCPECFKKLK